MTEPTITINGYPLTDGQAMAVRVAVELMRMDLEALADKKE